MPQLTAVTNELGEYRLAPLPIGVYEVAFEVGGFQPVRRSDIRLGVGFTATIDVQLGLSTVAESVTVSGAAPVVDVVVDLRKHAADERHPPTHGDGPATA